MKLWERVFLWILRWSTSRTLKLRAKRLLRRQGFIVYCQCGSILNEHPATDSPEDGLYTYECHLCGAASTFDFITYPVPVKVKSPHQEHTMREHCC